MPFNFAVLGKISLGAEAQEPWVTRILRALRGKAPFSALGLLAVEKACLCFLSHQKWTKMVKSVEA